MMQDLLL